MKLYIFGSVDIKREKGGFAAVAVFSDGTTREVAEKYYGRSQVVAEELAYQSIMRTLDIQEFNVIAPTCNAFRRVELCEAKFDRASKIDNPEDQKWFKYTQELARSVYDYTPWGWK